MVPSFLAMLGNMSVYRDAEVWTCSWLGTLQADKTVFKVSNHGCVQESRQDREGRDRGRVRAAVSGPWWATGLLIGVRIQESRKGAETAFWGLVLP